MSNMQTSISQNWSLITLIIFLFGGCLMFVAPFYHYSSENSSIPIVTIFTLICISISIFLIAFIIRRKRLVYRTRLVYSTRSRAIIDQNIDYGAVSENCHWNVLINDAIATTNSMSNKEKKNFKKEVVSELKLVQLYTRFLSLEPTSVKKAIKTGLNPYGNYKEVDEINKILYEQLASNLLGKVDPVYLYIYANDIHYSHSNAIPILNTPNVQMTFWFYAILTIIFIITWFFFGWCVGLVISVYSFFWYSMVSAAINSNIKNNVNVIIQKIYQNLEGSAGWNGMHNNNWTKVIKLDRYKKEVSKFETWGLIINTLKMDRRLSIYTKNNTNILLYYGNYLYSDKQAAETEAILTDVLKKHIEHMSTYVLGIRKNLRRTFVPQILSKNNVVKQFSRIVLKSLGRKSNYEDNFD